MQMRTRLTACLLAVLAVAGAGCSKKNKSGAQKGSPKGAHAGLALSNGSEPFAAALGAAAEKSAKNQEMQVTVRDAKGDAAEQARAADQLLEQGVGVLLLDPIDPAALRPVLQKAQDRKVEVLTMGQTIPDAEVTCFVEYNQELSGQLLADYLGYRLSSGGKVGLLRGPETPAQQQRLEAFRAYLREKYPKVQVAGEGAVDAEGGERKVVEGLLREQPGLDAICALTDPLTLAAAQALRRSGGTGSAGGKRFVVGYGGAPETVAELKKPGSPLTMVLAVFPQRLGRQTMRLAARLMSGKRATPHTQLPVLPVTRDNWGSYAGYEGEIPVDVTIPWKSELVLDVVREPGEGGGQ